MYFDDKDIVLMLYVFFINCMVGLIYIFVLIILISIISKYKYKYIQRIVKVDVKYDKQFRVYSKKENITINKGNKKLKEIYHSCKVIDKTIPIPSNLLLETIVEIDDKTDFTDKQNIDSSGYASRSNTKYVRDCIEIKTIETIFDGKGKPIDKYLTHEKVQQIEFSEYEVKEFVKTEKIMAKIPINFERNSISVEKEESTFDVKTVLLMKNVLDVISYGETTVPSLHVSSQANEITIFMANSEPVLTSDTLLSDVEITETEYLENTIEINEIPTLKSHTKIKEMPLFENQIQITEVRGQSQKSNQMSTEVIEAEVPLFVEKVITERKIPKIIPIYRYKTKLIQTV